MTQATKMSFGQFFNSVYYAASESHSFMNQFCQKSRESDRHGMIEMILQLELTLNLKIKSFYTAKDRNTAEKISKTVKTTENESGEQSTLLKIDQLTKSIFAMDPNTPEFIEMIIMRARFWFQLGFYRKTSKDCDLALESLRNTSSDVIIDPNMADLQKSACNALKNQCSKLMKKPSGTREKNINCLSALPSVDGMKNKKLTTAIDAVALAYDLKRGRHLVATRNIKSGSVLIVDEPIAFSTDKQALLTNCLHCHVSLGLQSNTHVPCTTCQTVAFCSTKCRFEAWETYHKYECTIFNNFLDNFTQSRSHFQRSHLLLAYRMTVAKAVDRKSNTLDPEFLCYQDAKCADAKKSLEIDINLDKYNPLDYRTAYSLQTHCSKADPKVNLARAIKAVFFAKCLVYILGELEPEKTRETIGSREIVLVAVALMRHMQAIDCNAYEIVENFRDDATKTWEPRNIGGAIYTTVSLINHSCYPNVVRHSYGGKVVVRSVRFIKKGDEILDCYGPNFITDPLRARQDHFLKKYHFICTCEACIGDWKLPLPNEITFRCRSCGSCVDSLRSCCTSCSSRVDLKKLNESLNKSTRKRIVAIDKMLHGDYVQALPLLLEHNSMVEKILVAPSLEALKTQQSMIQCFNSMSNICTKMENMVKPR